ncbi:MAG: alpha/beta hydrolase [Thermotogota bacterium]|nr:alpha/beta hydrolase [Thermotogota bacterium]
MKKTESIKLRRKAIYTVAYECTDPLASVLIVHGLGEHIDRYERFARQMNEHRLNVYGFDNLGHGKSTGIRGYTSIEDSFLIIDMMIHKMSANHSDIPMALFGHSLGGLIGLRYLQEKPSEFYCAAISAPVIILDEETEKRMEKNAGLARLLPFITLDNNIEHEDISRNHSEVAAYSKDKLVHPKVSLKLALSIHKNVKAVNEKAGAIKTPLLLLKGMSDKVVPPDNIDEYFDRISSEKKVISKYPGAYHETIYDPEHGEQFRQDIIGWFRTNL